MKKIIEIKKLNVSLNKNKVFSNFDLCISKGMTSIIGTSASGKTTLAKVLAGLIQSDNVIISDLQQNKENLVKIRKKMAVILNEFDFIAETVLDELTFGMENLCLSKNQMDKKIKIITDIFDIKEIIEMDPNELTLEQKTITKISSFLLMEPKIIVLDDVLQNISQSRKIKLLKYLEENEMSLVNITSNMEEILLTEDLIVIDKGKIVLEGKTTLVLNEEKILKRLGFNLPFITDLSKQLISYELIKKVYYDQNELVGELWK